MPKVLIIESDATVAQTLSDEISNRGAQTVVTGEGTEALKLARKESPDLILLCVELSRGSGYSVCNKLKKDADLASIPLILTSSQATDETFEQHKKLRTRAEAYLKKPYEMETLIGVINQYVELGGGAAGGDDDELEVSLDDMSVEGEEDDLFDVSVEEDPSEGLLAATTEMAPTNEMMVSATAPGASAAPFAAQSTQVLVTGAEAESLRGEVRQLRQKVQRLEQTLQEKELEFNDRLLEESSRARDSVDLKKRLSQLEREMGKHQQAAEKARAEAEKAKQEVKEARRDRDQAENERQTLSDKIGQLVDKVKSLAAERDRLQTEVGRLQKDKGGYDSDLQNMIKVRDKAKKAVDIAMQLLDETGLAQ